jgi:hypothetical protein
MVINSASNFWLATRSKGKRGSGPTKSIELGEHNVRNGLKVDPTALKFDFRFTADSVAKVESCSGPNFWRKPDAQRGR